MLTKIKIIIAAAWALLISVFAVLFKLEKNRRITAEKALETAEQIAEASLKKDEAEEKISKLVSEVLKKEEIPSSMPDKILLPALAIFFFIGCAGPHTISVTQAPQLYVFEMGIEFVKNKNDDYCVPYIEAVKIQKVLKTYKDQINIYEEWRKSVKASLEGKKKK